MYVLQQNESSVYDYLLQVHFSMLVVSIFLLSINALTHNFSQTHSVSHSRIKKNRRAHTITNEIQWWRNETKKKLWIYNFG